MSNDAWCDSFAASADRGNGDAMRGNYYETKTTAPQRVIPVRSYHRERIG
jgi:hypothetical protein